MTLPVLAQIWPLRCRLFDEALQALETLPEGEEPLPAGPAAAFEFDFAFDPDAPVATGSHDAEELSGSDPFATGGRLAATYQLQETNAAQTQLASGEELSDASLAVLAALQQLGGEGGGGANSEGGEKGPLSVAACAAGMRRDEACRLFYQLLGALLVR